MRVIIILKFIYIIFFVSLENNYNIIANYLNQKCKNFFIEQIFDMKEDIYLYTNFTILITLDKEIMDSFFICCYFII